MTSYSMNEKGDIVKDPATEKDFCAWADAYQAKYFSRHNPDVKIKLVDDAGGNACFAPETKTAYIERAVAASENFSRIALLHEMVHINLFDENGDPDADHGPRFKGEIKRLMKAGAYDNLL